MSVMTQTAAALARLKAFIDAKTGKASADLTAAVGNLSKQADDAVEVGKQAAYDAFWDEYQQNGTRKMYAGAFSGLGWTEKTFKPKYRITPAGTTGAENVFNTFNRVTTDRDPTNETLFDFSPYKDMVDFSGATMVNGAFMNARVKNVFLNLENATSATNIFNMNNGGQVDGITMRVTNKTTGMNGAFSNAYLLVEFRFTEDSEIVATLSFQHSTKLSKDSILSIWNALSTTTGKTVTFSKTAVNSAFETSAGANDGSTSAEWLALIGTKTNWTVSLV